MRESAVGVMAILAVALMVEVTFAFPCARSERSGDFNCCGFVNMLDLANLTINWLDANCRDSNLCECADGGGPDNGHGTALSDSEMRQQASFINWDFDTIWMICEGKDYPRLQWEQIQCEE